MNRRDALRILGLGAAAIVFRGALPFADVLAPPPDAAPRIQAAIDQAAREMRSHVYVPANMLPYNQRVVFASNVQLVREGSAPEVMRQAA